MPTAARIFSNFKTTILLFVDLKDMSQETIIFYPVFQKTTNSKIDYCHIWSHVENMIKCNKM